MYKRKSLKFIWLLVLTFKWYTYKYSYIHFIRIYIKIIAIINEIALLRQLVTEHQI